MKHSLLLLITLVAFSGCVTHKSRKEQSKLAQFYHNTTAKYNGWFNANELLELSIQRLKDQHHDNYNEILPIYEYAAVENADAVKADLDEAIKKVSVVVTLHEYSDWSDDCYHLIGKALYLKKDYEAAENAYEFYMDEFLPNGKRAEIKARKGKKGSSVKKSGASAQAKAANKRKKELQKAREKAEKERKAYNKALRNQNKKGKPAKEVKRKGTTKAADGETKIKTSEDKKYDATKAEIRAKNKLEGEQSGILIHESVYDEAILWLAKTYIERENWTGADFQLRRLESDDILFPKVREELPVVRAYYHMKRRNYPQVIPFLEQAIERASKRNAKARYSYILAQLYDRASDPQKAAEWYEKSLAYSNQYEMEFNTELSIIRSGVKNKTLSKDDAMARLEKMVKDFKNQPYLGRIYYLMAGIAKDENDIPSAINYLEQSVANIKDDKFQEIESQYMLATLYLQTQDYVSAEGAYKACLAVMKDTDPRYKEVKKFADNLTDIAVNLTTIKLQDSLLVLSYKTEDELKELAKVIKKQKQEEAEKAAAIAAQNAKAANASNIKNPINNPIADQRGGPSTGGIATPGVQSGSSSTIFWAFDSKQIKKTKREFDRTWGDIPLTDFWRVSNLSNQYASTAEQTGTGEVAAIGVYESEIQDFFKDVPKTDSARTINHNLIRKSMLLLGGLYRDRLEENESSIEVLEELLKRYPDAPEKLEVYYQLYLSSVAALDDARAQLYKNKILSEFPNSRFAKVLSDPNFAASQKSDLEKLNHYYEETYQMVQDGKYKEVLERMHTLEDKFGAKNVLMAKFDLLKAMCMGAEIGQEAYIDGLKSVIANYPNSPEEKKAKDIMLLLGKGSGSAEYGAKGLEAANFTLDDNELHFVIVYVENQDEIKMSVSDTKIAIAEFNNEFFKLDNLKMSNLVFDPAKNHSLILIRSFATKEKSMEYYKAIERNKAKFLPANAKFKAYPITQKNYREVIKARTLDTYQPFFQEFYLNSKN